MGADDLDPVYLGVWMWMGLGFSGSVRFEFVPSNSVGPNRWIQVGPRWPVCVVARNPVDCGIGLSPEFSEEFESICTLWNSPNFLEYVWEEFFGA